MGVLRDHLRAAGRAGAGRHGHGQGMAPVRPDTVEKKTTFFTKPPDRFKIFATESNSKLWRFKRGS